MINFGRTPGRQRPEQSEQRVDSSFDVRHGVHARPPVPPSASGDGTGVRIGDPELLPVTIRQGPRDVSPEDAGPAKPEKRRAVSACLCGQHVIRTVRASGSVYWRKMS